MFSMSVDEGSLLTGAPGIPHDIPCPRVARSSIISWSVGCIGNIEVAHVLGDSGNASEEEDSQFNGSESGVD
jgi:hypothetical protein